MFATVKQIASRTLFSELYKKKIKANVNLYYTSNDRWKIIKNINRLHLLVQKLMPYPILWSRINMPYITPQGSITRSQHKHCCIDKSNIYSVRIIHRVRFDLVVYRIHVHLLNMSHLLDEVVYFLKSHSVQLETICIHEMDNKIWCRVIFFSIIWPFTLW